MPRLNSRGNASVRRWRSWVHNNEYINAFPEPEESRRERVMFLCEKRLVHVACIY